MAYLNALSRRIVSISIKRFQDWKPLRRPFETKNGLPRSADRYLGYGFLSHRAGDGTRTHDVQLGKLAFYQLNYARVPTK
jgi:hypothetical protein